MTPVGEKKNLQIDGKKKDDTVKPWSASQLLLQIGAIFFVCTNVKRERKLLKENY